jgi:zinc/manganese transport system ATP-binding protein/zinc transport system ATP-binding protein
VQPPAPQPTEESPLTPLVELNQVSFAYGAQAVLSDVCLQLKQGQFAALVGPSGAGKTTLLKLVLGTLAPTRGRVSVHGRDVAGRPPPGIGYVPQLETVDWNFPITVAQVVQLGRIRRSGRWPWPSRAEAGRAAELLERLGLAGLGPRHIRKLSGGQQQRVFLARALMAEPDLLVLDEPTAGVDMRTAEEVLHLLAELNRAGTTVLVTTHDLNAAAAHVPWVVCLNRRVVAQGPTEDVFTDELLSATYEGDMVVLRDGDSLFVQQKPHGHGYRNVLPNPVGGEIPA